MFSDYLALTMMGSLFLLLMFGYPVAFTLGGVGLLFGFFGLDFIFLSLLPQRIWGVMTNYTLIAVPLFIFMGVTLERSQLAEDLLEAMALLFGKFRGGMAFSVIITGALLAAATGIVGASVVTMGLIALPVMLKRKMPKSFSCGVICASGTLGQIIPPSIVLVLLGDIMGVSIGELFVAAVLPGLLLVAGYALFTVFYFWFTGAEVEVEQIDVPPLQLLLKLAKALLPTFFLIVSVLGSIFFGVASPTEAASVGAFGALLITMAHKRLDYPRLKEIMSKTVSLTTMVFMILIGATLFGLVFRGLGGDDLIRDLVLSMPYGKAAFILITMLILFVLGCFLDIIEIIFIIVPILVPIIADFNIDPLWFAVLIAVNLQTSFLTPPLGFSLFYLKGVAPPEIKSSDIYRGVVPFVAIQAVVLTLLVLFPEVIHILANWLES